MHLDVVVKHTVMPRVGWSDPSSTPACTLLRDQFGFPAGPFDRCIVDGGRVTVTRMEADPLFGRSHKLPADRTPPHFFNLDHSA